MRIKQFDAHDSMKHTVEHSEDRVPAEWAGDSGAQARFAAEG